MRKIIHTDLFIETEKKYKKLTDIAVRYYNDGFMTWDELTVRLILLSKEYKKEIKQAYKK